MEEQVLNVTKRDNLGKGNSGRSRTAGLVPSVIYQKGQASKSMLVNENEFRKIAERAKTSQVYVLKSDDKDLDGMKAIIKDVQSEYLKGKLLHIDFQRVTSESLISVRVPVSVYGDPVGVKAQGGVLTVVCREIKLRCPGDKIPSEIKIDVSNIKLGERIRTGEIELPESSVLAGNPLETVASVISGRAARIQAAGEKDETGQAPASGSKPAAKAAAPAKKK